ncbi:hypothetical protein [Ponticaulis sp.]|uniref:hypothetical protein n=1 Tax=Ponticaulis sp. TaxID=2020902 RepID=UPI00263319C5|nr:hypothetical protein [Ponticaulis sp.]MDF1681355.1 hypothetical protein [Ponticaulis sp.]
MMKWIFGVLVIMAATIVVAMFGGAPDMVSGGPHPEYAGMSIGGDSAARLEGLWIEGLILYFATFLMAPAFMAFGVAEHNRNKIFWTMMGGVTALNLVFATLLIVFYVDFLNTGETFMLLGFPAPTAMMLYGCWGTAALYTAIYIAGFNKFIFTPEDEKTFEALIAAKNAEKTEA